MMHQKQKRAVTTAIAIGLVLMPASVRGAEQGAAPDRIVMAQSSGDRCRGSRCDTHKRHDDKRKDNKLKDDIALGLFGLAVGAIVAGAVAGKEVPAEVAARERWLDRCAARHRFFDRSTGTFIGRDGRRHACRR